MSNADRRRFRLILFLAGIVFLAMSAMLANATTLVHMPFEDLAQESTAVARLKCLGAESRWDGREIWTETRFEVMELDKGLLPGLVTVRMMGGRVGHLHSRIDGVPTFQVGEEVYLFLWNRRQGEAYTVLGWSQGTFRIARNTDTGMENVTQDSAMASVFDPGTREFRRRGVRNLPVALFRVKLRKALTEKK
jgi:hypothetical protein